MKLHKPLLAAVCLSIGLYFLYYSWSQRVPDVIVESKRITDIYSYIKPHEYNKDLLVIFDIDNTIARPPTDLSSDQWFYAMVHQLEASGKSHQEAINLVLPLFIHIQRDTWLVPVEKDTIPVINALQEKGVSVMALTARSLEVTYRTLEQLHDRDYPFIGIRYGYMDDRVRNFSLASIADEQAQFFDKHPFAQPLAAP